ncbi:MAG: DUF4405 domain-containing protein [Alphaproteobacteria bacterium]|nr:DUF4405 domain-containing protein [Alphaproteobacteria bacterium]
MNPFLRNYATPLSFVTFLATGVTGVMLFFELRSRTLSEVHEWVGMLFVTAIVLHLVRNWRSLLAMLSTPRSKVVVGGLSTVAALLVLVNLPFSSGHSGHDFRGLQQVVQKLTAVPIAQLAPALGMTDNEAILRLRKGGVAVTGPEQSLAEIANDQHKELPKLLNLVIAEPEA